MIQLVTPVLVVSEEGFHPLTAFARTTIRFVPEPGLVVLLLSGVIGLAVIGRTRAKP